MGQYFWVLQIWLKSKTPPSVTLSIGSTNLELTKVSQKLQNVISNKIKAKLATLF